MIQLADHVIPERVLDLTSRSKEAALMELVQALSGSEEVSDPEALLQALIEREHVVSTGIGGGVAVPHAKIASVSEFVVAYGRSHEGIDFGSVDGRPVHHVVLIAGPTDRQQRYLQVLAHVVQRLKSAELRLALEGAESANEMYRALVA